MKLWGAHYEVRVYQPAMTGDGWHVGTVWTGSGFIEAVREFRKAQRDRANDYVALYWRRGWAD